jgi:hypothetical protein
LVVSSYMTAAATVSAFSSEPPRNIPSMIYEHEVSPFVLGRVI